MNISHSIQPIRQPNLNDCWATAVAMVLRLQGTDVVNDVKRRAARITLNPNGSIPPQSVRALAGAVQLNFLNLQTPPQPLSTTLLTRVLRNAAAAGFGEYNYPGAPTATQHVLLFYRLSGSDADPMVYFIDPYTGRRYNYLVSEINEALGSVDYFLYR